MNLISIDKINPPILIEGNEQLYITHELNFEETLENPIVLVTDYKHTDKFISYFAHVNDEEETITQIDEDEYGFEIREQLEKFEVEYVELEGGKQV